MTHPVRVAGAGPSGLAAAVRLAQAGVAVEVRERRGKVAARFSNCVHGVENWSTDEPLLEALRSRGLDLSVVLSPCKEVVMCNESSSRTLSSEQPLFYLARRGDGPSTLEGALLRQAIEAGATVKFGQTFAPGEVDIDATGGRYVHRTVCERGVQFRTRSADVAAALVSRELTPHGYAYLLTYQGWGSLSVVQFGANPPPPDRVHGCLTVFRRYVELEMKDERPSAGFGTYQRACRPDGDSQGWRIGEAAGFQDFLWGFGIRNALESGVLAAECTLASTEYPGLALHTQSGSHQAAVVNRYLWDKTAALGFGAYVHLLDTKRDLRSALRGASRERSLHRLLYPFVRPRIEQRFPHLKS